MATRFCPEDGKVEGLPFPGGDRIADPMIELCYEIEIRAAPAEIWPWIRQLGYHRGGWYIDTWWDRFLQRYFWPLVVPAEARGSYRPPAEEILPEHQELTPGDIIPDGPEGTAYYEVAEIEENRLLLLHATTHFDYMAPRWVYRTRWAPRGAFCWAFLLSGISPGRTRLTSWWRGVARPRTLFVLLVPFFELVDGVHQKEILRGIRRRVEAG